MDNTLKILYNYINIHKYTFDVLYNDKLLELDNTKIIDNIFKDFSINLTIIKNNQDVF